MPKAIERGDLYFFYRTKIDVERASSRDDVQRFYMVMVPDGDDKARLVLIGRKRLPDVISKGEKPTSKEWGMVVAVDHPEKIRQELHPISYETSTKGTRHVGEAIPVGEGRYALVHNKDDSRLLYKLYRPEKPGKAQKELGILAEASLIISIRNPDLEVKGFPKEKPEYPKAITEKFADERWLAVEEPKMLQYENVQLLLIGASSSLDDEDIEVTGRPDMRKKLEMDKDKWQLDSLESGSFARPQGKPKTVASAGDRSKGGKKGGVAALKTASAAGVAKSLKGVEFPKEQSELVRFAEQHDANADVVDLLKLLPSRRYDSMVEIQKAVGEVR